MHYGNGIIEHELTTGAHLFNGVLHLFGDHYWHNVCHAHFVICEEIFKCQYRLFCHLYKLELSPEFVIVLPMQS